ncbi:hypothetical protein [Leptospira barantonii]|uniref:hypothetical protein n=1 Tax=Leptospira barantonii TaxID=2023184 RepID=UPI001AD80081|nr:hypothetical protein [Leptospira barantonii]
MRIQQLIRIALILLLSVSFSSVFAQTQYKDQKNGEGEAAPEWTPDPDRKSKFGKEEDDKKPYTTPKSTDFLVYGATIGSPASINFNIGYYYKDIVVRASGGKWNPHWWGGQVDIGYSFWKTPVIAHSISLVFGKFQVDPFQPEVGRGGQNHYPSGSSFPGYTNRDPTYEDLIIRSYVSEQSPELALYLEHESRDRQKVHLNQQYVGLTYDFLLGNFFLQLGAGIGKGDYKNPQILLQMGYLFDTR